MKVWKKLAGVVLALAVMMTLCVAAGATSATLSSGVAKDSTTPYDYGVIDNTLTIPKSITVTGSTGKVYGPSATYAYDIAAADITSTPTVDDGTHTARPVKAGIAGGVTIGSAVFTSAEETLSSGNATVTANVTVTVVPSQFTAPGIYRYHITEAAANTAALYAAGVTRPAADDFYLDVYIRNTTQTVNDEEEEVRAVYGYVLLSGNTNVTTSTEKISAFTTDTYNTMDFTVTKSVTGNMGDKTHEFDFGITVSNSDMYFYSGKTTASETAANGTALTTVLKDGESFVIKGLNPKATVTVTETNNTPDEYTVSVQDNASTPSVFVTAAPVAASGTKATSALAVSDYDTANSDTDVTTAPTASDYNVITFVNNLNAISPTGVVLRYAPYLAMMGAGVVALPLSLRKKEEMF